jgi:hypothetical protein
MGREGFRQLARYLYPQRGPCLTGIYFDAVEKSPVPGEKLKKAY